MQKSEYEKILDCMTPEARRKACEGFMKAWNKNAYKAGMKESEEWDAMVVSVRELQKSTGVA